MKRALSLALCLAWLLCGAAHGDNIDTICTGMHVQAAIDRYGEPTRVEELDRGKRYAFDDLFGPGSRLSIETEGQDGFIMLIYARSTADQCLTAKGIHAGCSMNDVKFAYGSPHEEGRATLEGTRYLLFIYHVVSVEGAGEQELNLFFEEDTRILDAMILQKRGWR